MPSTRKPRKPRTTTKTTKTTKPTQKKSKTPSKLEVTSELHPKDSKLAELVVCNEVEEKTSETETKVNLEENIKGDFLNLLDKVQSLRTIVQEINTEVKVLQKKVSKEIKTLIKTQKKIRKTGSVRAPSGFAKPTKISTELCKFLNITPGTLMARTEVTKKLTQYIKEHGLQNEADKRIILPDKKLSKLLSVKKDDNITYFNLQRWIKPHFIKNDKE